MINKLIILQIICLSTLFIRCSVAPLAGGSDNPDFIVLGSVTDNSGKPVRNAIVTILPQSYNPVTDAPPQASMTDTTDTAGVYKLVVTHTGIYNVQGIDPHKDTRMLVTGISVINDTSSIKAEPLSVPGAVSVVFPLSADSQTTGYVYIPGTNLFAYLNSSFDTVKIDSVPVGTLPVLTYTSSSISGSTDIRYDIPVVSNKATIVLNLSWKYSRYIFFNTTVNGANVAESVIQFPLLIRLNKSNFDFSQAQPDGADILFTKANGTRLPYEIDRWDAVNGCAEIWVKVDTVYGNDSSQFINLYWGNSKASGISNGKDVFSTQAGFQGVWHLCVTGSDIIADATGNGYNGTPCNMDLTSVVEGVIGNARYFDGTTSYITIPNSASGSLDMPQNGEYSISLWAYADTIDTLWHAIAGKGHEQYYLKLKCFYNGKATWEFVEFQDQKGWEHSEDSIPPAPGAKEWVYLTGVRSGTEQSLYVNGVKVNNSNQLMQGEYPRNTSDDFTIGKYARNVTIPYEEGWCYFQGKIDEIRVMSYAPSPAWIRLCYMNQKPEDMLVEFR